MRAKKSTSWAGTVSWQRLLCAKLRLLNVLGAVNHDHFRVHHGRRGDLWPAQMWAGPT